MQPTGGRLRLTVVAVSVFLSLIQIVAFALGIPLSVNGHAAFMRFYTAGYMVRTGQSQSLYDYGVSRRIQSGLAGHDDEAEIFDSPAYEALLFVPFSLLRYRTAYIIFFVANLALLALSIRMLIPYVHTLEKIWRWLPAVLFVCFFPCTLTLILGQDSIMLLTLTVASAVAFYRGRDVVAGVVLGLTLFKYQFAVPVVLLFLFWRRWRMVAAFVGSGIAVAIVSFSLSGLDGRASASTIYFLGTHCRGQWDA